MPIHKVLVRTVVILTAKDSNSNLRVLRPSTAYPGAGLRCRRESSARKSLGAGHVRNLYDDAGSGADVFSRNQPVVPGRYSVDCGTNY